MLKKFLKNTSGNFGAMGVFSITALIGSVGLAVDYIGMTNNVAQLQSAADNALLTAATSGETDEATLERIADETLKGFMSDGFDVNADYEFSDEKIQVSANVSYTPKIMGILGFGDRVLRVNAAVPRGGIGALDIALVLDVTDSMQGAKLQEMQVAVNNFIDQFETSGGDIRISIIPFSQYVNVGANNRNEPWIDNSEEGSTFPPVPFQETTDRVCLGTVTTSSCDYQGDGVTLSRNCNVCSTGFTNGIQTTVTIAPEKNWQGCVGSRVGNKARQAFYGGTPFPAVYNDSYKGFPYSQTKYACAAPLLPLTDDFNAVRSKVQSLSTTGETYMPAGLAWGWRTLDHDVPFGIPLGGDTRKRALILMTDGVNTISRLGSDRYHYGSNGVQPTATTDANRETERLCDNIASENILVYTIAYELPPGADADTTKTLLSECASTPDSFFNSAGGANLNEAFEAIGTALGEIRLVN